MNRLPRSVIGLLEKGGTLPIGTVRTWGGHEFKKMTADDWVRVSEKQKTGAPQLEEVGSKKVSNIEQIGMQQSLRGKKRLKKLGYVEDEDGNVTLHLTTPKGHKELGKEFGKETTVTGKIVDYYEGPKNDPRGERLTLQVSGETGKHWVRVDKIVPQGGAGAEEEEVEQTPQEQGRAIRAARELWELGYNLPKKESHPIQVRIAGEEMVPARILDEEEGKLVLQDRRGRTFLADKPKRGPTTRAGAKLTLDVEGPEEEKSSEPDEPEAPPEPKQTPEEQETIGTATKMTRHIQPGKKVKLKFGGKAEDRVMVVDSVGRDYVRVQDQESGEFFRIKTGAVQAGMKKPAVEVGDAPKPSKMGPPKAVIALPTKQGISAIRIHGYSWRGYEVEMPDGSTKTVSAQKLAREIRGTIEREGAVEPTEAHTRELEKMLGPGDHNILTLTGASPGKLRARVGEKSQEAGEDEILSALRQSVRQAQDEEKRRKEAPWQRTSFATAKSAVEILLAGPTHRLLLKGKGTGTWGALWGLDVAVTVSRVGLTQGDDETGELGALGDLDAEFGAHGLEKPRRIAVMGQKAKALLEELLGNPPDLVVNLYEWVGDKDIRKVSTCSLLEAAGIPYTGNDAFALATATDKSLAKNVLRGAGIRTAPWRCVKPGEEIPEMDDFPYLVKPNATDNSMGIDSTSVVKTQEQLEKKVQEIHEKFKDAALIEGFLPGREFDCVVIEREGTLDVLPIEETVYSGGTKVADHAAKFDEGSKEYRGSDSQMAKIEDALRNEIEEQARACFRAFRCRDAMRIDVRLDDRERPDVLEVNPNPDLSWEHAIGVPAGEYGWKRSDLWAIILGNALKRREAKKSRAGRMRLVLAKARPFPVGTVRYWKGQAFVKMSQGRWIPYNMKEGRDATETEVQEVAASGKGRHDLEDRPDVKSPDGGLPEPPADVPTADPGVNPNGTQGEESKYAGELTPEQLFEDEPGLRHFFQLSETPTSLLGTVAVPIFGVGDPVWYNEVKGIHPFLLFRLRADYGLALQCWKVADEERRGNVPTLEEFEEKYPKLAEAAGKEQIKSRVARRGYRSSLSAMGKVWSKMLQTAMQTGGVARFDAMSAEMDTWRIGKPESKWKTDIVFSPGYADEIARRWVERQQQGAKAEIASGKFPNIAGINLTGLKMTTKQMAVVDRAIGDILERTPEAKNLAIKTGLKIQGTRVPATKANGVYIPSLNLIELDSRWPNALAHEFCHFFDHQLMLKEKPEWAMAIEKAKELGCQARWLTLGWVSAQNLSEEGEKRAAEIVLKIGKTRLGSGKSAFTYYDIKSRLMNYKAESEYGKYLSKAMKEEGGLTQGEFDELVNWARGSVREDKVATRATAAFFDKQGKRAREHGGYLCQPGEMLARLFEQHFAIKAKKDTVAADTAQKYLADNRYYTMDEYEALLPYMESAFETAGGKGFLKSVVRWLVFPRLAKAEPHGPHIIQVPASAKHRAYRRMDPRGKRMEVVLASEVGEPVMAFPGEVPKSERPKVRARKDRAETEPWTLRPGPHKLAGYRWHHVIDEDDKAVSNWEEAEECARCGARIVHVYEVAHGDEKSEYRESVGKECVQACLDVPYTPSQKMSKMRDEYVKAMGREATIKRADDEFDKRVLERWGRTSPVHAAIDSNVRNRNVPRGSDPGSNASAADLEPVVFQKESVFYAMPRFAADGDKGKAFGARGWTRLPDTWAQTYEAGTEAGVAKSKMRLVVKTAAGGV